MSHLIANQASLSFMGASKPQKTTATTAPITATPMSSRALSKRRSFLSVFESSWGVIFFQELFFAQRFRSATAQQGRWL
jgi:hypothetical protein